MFIANCVICVICVFLCYFIEFPFYIGDGGIHIRDTLSDMPNTSTRNDCVRMIRAHLILSTNMS